MNIYTQSSESIVSPGRRALVLAAERLVAKYGPSGFTIRMLNAEAGVRNTSAVHYHFGSLDSLIKAVWEYRMATINPRRLEMLGGVTATDIQRIVKAIIVPMGEQLQPRPEGNYYLRFMERLAREANYAAYGPELDWAEGWIRAHALLREGLSDFPAEITEVKLRFASTLITSGLADIEANMEQGTLRSASLSMMIEALQDAAVTLLRAPLAGRRGTG